MRPCQKKHIMVLSTTNKNGGIMHKIAVIGGDGTGPEVVEETGAKAINQQHNIECDFIPMDVDGTRFMATGDVN